MSYFGHHQALTTGQSPIAVSLLIVHKTNSLVHVIYWFQRGESRPSRPSFFFLGPYSFFRLPCLFSVLLLDKVEDLFLCTGTITNVTIMSKAIDFTSFTETSSMMAETQVSSPDSTIKGFEPIFSFQ